MAQDARKKLGWWQYLGYGVGDVSNNLTFQTVAAFLLIYYTDVARIPVATAGTLFLVVRVWGGFTDLFAGRAVDKTSTRWGKFRPYLLFGSLPLLALNVIVFSIPGSLSETGKVIFAYVSYALFSLAYSFVNIPYGSLAAAMTQVPDERSKLSTSRMVCSSLTILLVSVAISPQISGSPDLQRSLTITIIVFGVLGFLLYLWCFLASMETVKRVVEEVGLAETARMMVHNRPLVLLGASSLLFLIGMYSQQTVGIYYARNVLGSAEFYVPLTVVQTVAMIAAAAAVPLLVQAMDKKPSYVLAAGVAALGGLGIAVAPASVPAVAIACFGILGLGLGAINTLIFSVQADTVDYGEWKTGVRAEGGSYAVLSFMRKAGQGIGGALAAYVIGVGGYISGAVVQLPSAATAIRVAAGALPAAFILAAAGVMLAYPLTERAFRGMIAEIAERRATGASPA